MLSLSPHMLVEHLLCTGCRGIQPGVPLTKAPPAVSVGMSREINTQCLRVVGYRADGDGGNEAGVGGEGESGWW